MSRQLEPFVIAGIVNKLQTDTYIREIERYGDSTIANAEVIFHLDSTFVLNILKYFADNGDDLKRHLVTIKCIDEILTGFKQSLTSKIEICSAIVQQNVDSHGSTFTKDVDEKYRKYGRNIQTYLETGDVADADYIEINKLWDQRMRLFAPIYQEIYGLFQAVNGEPPIRGFATNIIHMFVNRILVSDQKKNEFIFYGLLKKYYWSVQARRNLVRI